MQKLWLLSKHNISKGAAGTLMLNICNQLFLFLILALLARSLTTDAFGLYAVILSVMTLLALPFAGGFAVFVMRHVSKYSAQNDHSHLKGVFARGMIWSVGGAFLFSICLYFILPLLIKEDVEYYRWGLPIIFLSSLMIFLGAILRGLKKVVWGRLSEFFLQPVLFLILLILLFQNLKLDDVFKLYAVSFFIPILISLCLVIKFLPHNFNTIKAQFDDRVWVKSAIPLMLSVGLIVANMNIDVVMVGVLANEEEAGQYRVASRLAAFVPFFLFAVNNAVAPRISALHTKGDTQKLQNILTMVARVTFILTLPVALLLFVFGQNILGLFFGASFTEAAISLSILVVANSFSVLMGQVGQVMSLTGHEKYSAYAVLASLIVNVSLNYILVPKLGMNGAAIATGVSIVVWNGLLAYWTVKKTGLHCTALGPIGKRAIQ